MVDDRFNNKKFVQTYEALHMLDFEDEEKDKEKICHMLTMLIEDYGVRAVVPFVYFVFEERMREMKQGYMNGYFHGVYDQVKKRPYNPTFIHKSDTNIKK